MIGATLIDGNGGLPISDTTIVVRNGVIKEVENRNSMSLEDNIHKVDVSGLYLMSGLIGSHAHIAGVSSSSPIDWIAESNYLQAIRTVAEARRILDYGFMTVRS